MVDGRVLPEARVASLEAWLEGDGGLGLAHALDMAPDAVVATVDEAGLRGRGGAGFPTGRKWRSVIDAAERTGSPTYVVVNAAEGEPGTYKDRPLIAANPYVVLEGLLVAMHATDAQAGFVATKASFPDTVARLRSALAEMVAAGWARAADIKVVQGPDSYLFGEESALLEVVEGGDALPRVLKPYDVGLFASPDGQHPNPTVVNNVETMAHVTTILANGSDWFREVGTEASPGTMLFTVVGDVSSPGTYELPLGTTLRQLLDVAGAAGEPGMVWSGVSNPVMTAAHLDVPLCFDAMRDAGGGIGSGGFVVHDAERSPIRALHTMSRFLAGESCGQCNSCLLGTAAIVEALDDLEDGAAATTAVPELLERARSATDDHRCYLPVGAQAMVTSTLEAFGSYVATSIDEDATDGGRPYPVPLVKDIDEDTGEVTYAEDRW